MSLIFVTILRQKLGTDGLSILESAAITMGVVIGTGVNGVSLQRVLREK